MTVSAFTVLCNHHHRLVLEHFHCPKAGLASVRWVTSHPCPQSLQYLVFIQSLVDRHMGCFRHSSLAVMDNAAVNIVFKILCFTFLGCIPVGGIGVSCQFYFNSWRCPQWLPHFTFPPATLLPPHPPHLGPSSIRTVEGPPGSPAPVRGYNS